jgi:hypothetical protein
MCSHLPVNYHPSHYLKLAVWSSSSGLNDHPSHHLKLVKVSGYVVVKVSRYVVVKVSGYVVVKMIMTLHLAYVNNLKLRNFLVDCKLGM